MTTTGAGLVKARLQDVEIDIPVLIAPNLREELILGFPWFNSQAAVIDLQRKCIHIGNSDRRTIYFSPIQPTMPEAPPNVDETAILSTIPPNHRDMMQRTLRDFKELFSTSHRPNRTTATKHTIRLRDTKPCRVPPYRYSPEKKRIIAEQVEEMLANEVIRPSTSEYNSPIVLVKKKDGKMRFCVDYRKLNSKTEDEVSLLPPIYESLKELGSARIFTTLDLKSGYWQVEMAEESKHLSAFITPEGAAYEFNVMPFGLKNSPTTFQKMMTQEVLIGFLHKFVRVYLDDVIIYSDTWEEHHKHVRQVFERLQQYSLKLAPEKCVFGASTLPFLGHILTETGNKPQEGHIDAIRAATPPKTRKQLRQFLGLINWLRDYVPRCAELIAPLTDLLSTKRTYRWDLKAQEAFERVKNELSRPLHLHRPDFKLPFTLQTDASGEGISAVLHQEHPTGRRVITYASSRFNAAERRYHINEQECLAVVWAVKKFRPFLEDRKFTLKTDSRALLWLDRTKDARSKLTRWALLLQEFKFEVQHCPGKENELPDALSRSPENRLIDPEIVDETRLIPEYNNPPTSKQIDSAVCLFQTMAATDPADATNPVVVDVQNAQQQDETVAQLVQKWTRMREEGPAENEDDAILQLYSNNDGYLRRRLADQEVLVVPNAAKLRVLYEYHDCTTAGHPSADETIRAIESRFYWNALRKDAREYVRACPICTCYKRGPRQGRAPLRPHQPTKPFEVLSVDLIGPLPKSRSGKRNIIVCTDLCTRWVEAIAVGATPTKAIVRFLESLFCRFGYPKSVLTDNGPQFRSAVWRDAVRRWDATHWTTPVYHPRANPVERRNQEIKKGLRIHLADSDTTRWDERLNDVLFNIRSRRNAATGYSPARALFGKELSRPGDWRENHEIENETREERIINIQANEQRYREGRYANDDPMPITYHPNELVLIKSHPLSDKPFAARWLGPYPVVRTAGPTAYWIQRGGGSPVKYHLDQLRRYTIGQVEHPAAPEEVPQPGTSRECQ